MRATAVGPGGQVLADVVMAAGEVLAVPPGTRRIALVGLGDDTAALKVEDVAADVLGWANDAPLPYIGGEVFLGYDAVIASSGRIPSRRAAPVRTGWVAADAVVAGTSAVVTTFARPVDVIAVAMEGGAGDDLALGIDGARRRLGKDGRPEPPTVVADGPRAVAVFRVVPDDGGRVVVTVSTGPSRRLVGVAGARGVAAGAFATAVADRGFPVVVPGPVPPATGAAVVVWKGQG